MDLNSIKEICKLSSDMSVLYVEDEENVREQLTKMFHKMFASVDIACDGDEAFLKYKSKNYDLVITDLNMPSMNGLTLVNKIKENKFNQPIIIISAGQNIEEILSLVEYGISGYLLKPIDIQKMFKLLHETVQKIYTNKKLEGHNKDIENKLNKKLLDPLTKLFNYTHLIDTLSDNSEKSAILINTNGLHLINEGYSYKDGDEFLFQFANMLKKEAVQCDSIAFRISGNNFLLLKNKTSNNCQELKEEAINIGKKIELKRFDLHETSNVNIDITMAIAKGKGNVLENLYKTLDYAKKKSLKYAFYNDIPDNSKIAKEIIDVKNMLQSSLDNDLLVPFFQPIVAKNGEVKHEVLMRIKDFKNEEKYITPVSFLEIAKEHNYYNEISQALILKAIKYAIISDGTFSLNFSYLDMRNESFLSILEKTIIDNKLGKRLIFEIVESDIIDDMNIVNNFLTRFKALGVLVAIDDFGSGYSNFEYIFNINPDYIKLDGSIVKNILKDEKMHVFVETMIKFAHKFNIKVIAEYVSSQELYSELLKMDVDAMQGYYLGRPSQNIDEKKYA